MERSSVRYENFFLIKGCKIAALKKVFLKDFFVCSLCLNIFLPPLFKVQSPNFLDFGIFEEKDWKEVVSDLTTFVS